MAKNNARLYDPTALIQAGINPKTGLSVKNNILNYVYNLGTYSPSVSLLALTEYVDARRLSSLMPQ